MVTTVLNKDYTGADCMLLLTNITTVEVDPDHKDLLDTTIDQCKKLLEAKIQSEVDKIRIATFQEDESSAIIRKAIKEVPGLQARLEDWLSNQGDITIHELLTEPQFAPLRNRAISELDIQRS